MVLTKVQKKDAMSGYTKLAAKAKNIALVAQNGVDVNDANILRRNLVAVDGTMQVVRKRIFLRAMQESGLQAATVGKLDGSVVALYAMGDEYATLGEIDKMNKKFKKAKQKCNYEYVGGWYDKNWKDGTYVATLATLPPKEVLVSKLLFLFNYPIQSFTIALDKIREQKS